MFKRSSNLYHLKNVKAYNDQNVADMTIKTRTTIQTTSIVTASQKYSQILAGFIFSLVSFMDYFNIFSFLHIKHWICIYEIKRKLSLHKTSIWERIWRIWCIFDVKIKYKDLCPARHFFSSAVHQTKYSEDILKRNTREEQQTVSDNKLLKRNLNEI